MKNSIAYSEKNFDIISKSLNGFVYDNHLDDVCDSVYSKDLDIGIYFPNSEKQLNENEFDTFSVLLNQERYIDEPIHYSFKTIEEVIGFIKSYIE